MNMKTTIALLICLPLVARADLDIREMTPTNVATSGWKVEIQQETDYVRFTVQLPEAFLAQVATAHLDVRQDRKLITSCILGLHKRNEGDRYEFAVATQYLNGAMLELSMKQTSPDGNVSYRMRLAGFATQKTKGIPNQVPEDTARKLADPQH